MARNYANIVTAIWRHAEFRALNSREQWLFLFLVTQPNISAVGVLPLTLGRWSSCAEDITADDIRAGMTILQSRRFIVFDPATDEVLVRSFVRWDGGHTNPKRRPVIMRAALEVESEILRRSIAAEFARLDLKCDGLVDSLSPTHSMPLSSGPAIGPESPVTSQVAAGTAGHLNETSADLFSQEDSLSNSLSGSVSASDGVVVTQGLYVVPHSTTLEPQTPAPAALPDPATSTDNQRAKAITDAYYAVEPMSNFPAVSKIVVKAIKAKRWSDEEIRDALLRMADSGRPVTTDGLRIELDGLPTGRASPGNRPNLIAAFARAQAREAATT